MDHRPQGSSLTNKAILLSKAIEGFMTFKIAEGLSKRTLESYEYFLKQWFAYSGDKPASAVNASDITHYLAWLRTDYKPKRWNGNGEPLSDLPPKFVHLESLPLSIFHNNFI
jgi:integrase/recombinase XerD